MSATETAPAPAFEEVVVTTRRDVTAPVRVYEPAEVDAAGADAATVMALHGAGGWLGDEPVLAGLAAAGLRVVAPVWPAWSEHTDEDRLSDMLDFALHGWDVATEMGLLDTGGPSNGATGGGLHLMGHSMGGMIAAEMAALAPQSVARMALLCPAGMWLGDHPIPDIFAMLPYQLAEVLFADPNVGEEVLTGGADFSDNATLTRFMVARARQQGMAGKILFPIPNRRFSERAYRVTVPTLLVWGRQDRLIPPAYADAWQAALPDATVELVDGAGHMLPYEQSEAVVAAVTSHLHG
ncbi:alpha/beta fold hydrolase [Candidatus Poriferisodalis sp.]|uniref:alpha/beta fold hydrolase n=1 Tax=Candidatus Poriferisodalis sp. TaxID=3101277 RepID=UPI003B0203F3